MSNWPLLSLLTFLPLLGVLLLLFVRGNAEQVASRSRNIALLITSITFLLSVKILLLYRELAYYGVGATADSIADMRTKYQFIEQHVMISDFGISYAMGVDAIALALIMLTTFLMPIAILASRHVAHRVREYFIAFLVLETMMIGTFCALDTILFYIFFEGVLLPMYLIIGIWGGPRRVYASFKFFLYTLLGSILMLLALIVLYMQTGTTDMYALQAMQSKHMISFNLQIWLWLAFFASFAVKLPMWPVHTWLPDAHVEAPTAGSIILAGVLLKMGGYGFIRFSLPMLPEASQYFAPMMWGLSLIAIVYTSLIALVQEDMKKLIAYSSIAHMGFVTLGLFSFNQYGLYAAMFQMISHGVVSGALFLCVGVLYDRMHTRQISAYGGVVNVMPRFAVFFLFMTLASVGMPGTSGFVGEFLTLVGVYQSSVSRLPISDNYTWLFHWSQTAAMLAATALVLGAAYMLWLYRKVMYGEVANDEVAKLKDIDASEFIALLALSAVVLWLGINAQSLLNFMSFNIEHYIAVITDRALCQVMTPPPMFNP